MIDHFFTTDDFAEKEFPHRTALERVQHRPALLPPSRAIVEVL